MYPGIDIQGTIQEHVDTAVHRIAMNAAIAFHALSSILMLLFGMRIMI
jgi:hypothetical protein